jgi:hypothetical protein
MKKTAGRAENVVSPDVMKVSDSGYEQPYIYGRRHPTMLKTCPTPGF